VTVELGAAVPERVRFCEVVIWSEEEDPVSVLMPVKTGALGVLPTLLRKASVPPPLLPW
jgi:hypothetical protein